MPLLENIASGSQTRLNTGSTCPSLRMKLRVSAGPGSAPSSMQTARSTPVAVSVIGSVYSGESAVGTLPSRL